MELLVIGTYLFFLTFILLYSINQFGLAVSYLKGRKQKSPPPAPLATLPPVTIQLPLYNEKYVAERLIRCLAQLNYPQELLEIQVLDDSTDETSDIVARVSAQLRSQGLDVQHIKRPERKDFKAGALQYGLDRCHGEFVAVFDADFLPDPDFLNQTLPHFENDRVGVVQSRWGHLNEHYSPLTQLQAYALNAHFSVEQSGRNRHGHFINFNGTAGIWRKACIYNAGGWQGDTLTEDLDLSYRAQLNHWQFVYLQDLVSPAELPAEMNALKSQQYRWAKGAAECVRKNLGPVLRSRYIKPSTKWHAFFHLTNSFVWVCVLFSGLLLPAFLYTVAYQLQDSTWLAFVGVYHFSFFALLFFYLVANASLSLKRPTDYVKMVALYPGFLAMSMGISLHNAIGVLKGYLGIKSAFVRTPKFNITQRRNGGFKGKSYIQWKPSFTNLLELLCLFYFAWASWLAFNISAFIALPFLLLQCFGFGMVLWFSWRHAVAK